MDELRFEYGFWIKITGMLLTGAGAAGTGISMGNRYRERLRLLEGLKKILSLLRSEILYANEPLEDAFRHTGERTNSPVSQLFLRISERMERKEGQSFFEMWQTEIEELPARLSLTKEDKRQLKGFGENLGYLDHAMQERTILLYQEQLEEEIRYLRVHLQEKTRLCVSLGIAAGLFLIIVMC